MGAVNKFHPDDEVEVQVQALEDEYLAAQQAVTVDRNEDTVAAYKAAKDAFAVAREVASAENTFGITGDPV